MLEKLLQPRQIGASNFKAFLKDRSNELEHTDPRRNRNHIVHINPLQSEPTLGSASFVFIRDRQYDWCRPCEVAGRPPGRPETPCPITSHSQNEGPVHNWVYIEESVTTLKEMKYGGTIMIMQSAMKRQMS